MALCKQVLLIACPACALIRNRVPSQRIIPKGSLKQNVPYLNESSMSCGLINSPVEYLIEYFYIAVKMIEYFLFKWTRAYFIYMRGTPADFSTQMCSECHFSWEWMQIWYSFCIFGALTVPSIVYYTSAFLLSVWHPEQQLWKCSGGCRRLPLPFLPPLCGVKWMFSIEVSWYDLIINCFKRTWGKSTTYSVQLGPQCGW